MKYSVNKYPELNSGVTVDCSLHFDLVTPGSLIDVSSTACQVIIPLYAYINKTKAVVSLAFESYAGDVAEFSILPKFIEAGLKLAIVPIESVEERGEIWNLLTTEFRKGNMYGLADPKVGGNMRVLYGTEETWLKCGISLKALGSKALKVWKLLTPPSRAIMYNSIGIKGKLRIGLVEKQTSTYTLPDGTTHTVPTHDGPVYGRVALFVRREVKDDGKRSDELTEAQIRLPFHGQGKGLYVCCPTQFVYLCGIGGFDTKDVHMVATMDAIKGPGYKAGDVVEIDLNNKDAFRLLKFKESQGRSSVSTQAIVYRDWSKIKSLLSDKLQDQTDEYGQTVSDYIYDVLQNRDAESLEFLTIGDGSSETAIADNTSHVIKNLCWAMWRPNAKEPRWEFPSYASNWTQILANMYAVYKDRCLKVRVGDQNFYVAYDNELKGNQVSMPIQNSFCKDLDKKLDGKFLNSSRAPFVSTYSISDIDPFLEDGTVRYNPTAYTIFCSPEFFTNFWMDGDGDLMMVWTSRVSFPFVQMPAPEDVKVYAPPTTDLVGDIANQFASAVQAAMDIGRLDMTCRYANLVRMVNNDPVNDTDSGWMGYVREVLTIKATKHHRGVSDSSYDQDVLERILEDYMVKPWMRLTDTGYRAPYVPEQHILHGLARKDAGIRMPSKSPAGRAPTEAERMNGIPLRIFKAKSQEMYNNWPWSVVMDKLGTICHLRPKHADSGIFKSFFTKQFEWAKSHAVKDEALRAELIAVACSVATQIIDYYKQSDTSIKLLSGGRDARFNIFHDYKSRKEQVTAAVASGELVIDKVSGTYEDIELLGTGKISRASKSRRYTQIREWVEGKYGRTHAFIAEKKGIEVADIWLRILGWRLGMLTFGCNNASGVETSFPGSEYWYMPDTNLILDSVKFHESRMNDVGINSPMNPWAEKYSDPKELQKLRDLQEERNAKKLAIRMGIESDSDNDDDSNAE